MNGAAKGWSYRKRRVRPRKGNRLWLNMERTAAIMQSEPLLVRKTDASSEAAICIL